MLYLGVSGFRSVIMGVAVLLILHGSNSFRMGSVLVYRHTEGVQYYTFALVWQGALQYLRLGGLGTNEQTWLRS